MNFCSKIQVFRHKEYRIFCSKNHCLHRYNLWIQCIGIYNIWIQYLSNQFIVSFTCIFSFSTWSCQHLCRHKVDLCVVYGLYWAFNSEHFSHSVLVSMLDLKLFPNLPEISCHLKQRNFILYLLQDDENLIITYQNLEYLEVLPSSSI